MIETATGAVPTGFPNAQQRLRASEGRAQKAQQAAPLPLVITVNCYFSSAARIGQLAHGRVLAAARFT